MQLPAQRTFGNDCGLLAIMEGDIGVILRVIFGNHTGGSRNSTPTMENHMENRMEAKIIAVFIGLLRGCIGILHQIQKEIVKFTARVLWGLHRAYWLLAGNERMERLERNCS